MNIRMSGPIVLPEAQAARHTPGPWRVECDGTSVCMAGQVCITDPGPDRATRAELKANAALIAAAPDLLAACRAALAEKSRAYQDTFDSRMDNDPTVRTLRAAIAKAEGR